MNTTHTRTTIKILLALLLLFGGIMRVAYSTDTYWVADVGLPAAAEDMLFKNGRVLTAIVYALCGKAGLTIPQFYTISYIGSILFYLATILLLNHMTREIVPDENARLLVCLALIINPFLVEYYMFIEMFAFAEAIFLAVVGVYCMRRLFLTGHLWYLLPAALAVLGAFMCYQASTGLFVILLIPYAYDTLRQNTSVRALLLYIRSVILIGVAYLIAAVGYIVIYEQVLKAIRDPGPTDSLTTIIKGALREEWKALCGTCGILPEYSYLVITVVALVCCALAIRRVQNRALWLLHLVACIGAVAAVAAAPAVAGNYYVARTLYPLGCIAGVLILDAAIAWQGSYCPATNIAQSRAEDATETPESATTVSVSQGEPKSTDGCKHARMLQRTAAALAAILLLLEVPCFARIYISKYRLNYADELRTYAVGEAIAEYEAESGNTITKIAFYEDAKLSVQQYPGLFHSGDIIVSSYITTWSDDEALNYYLGTDYDKVDPDPEIAAYYKTRDWDTYSAEQLTFDGDTLHYCVY